jgi:hypothetical protein
MTQQTRLITYAVVLILVLLLAWFGAPKREFVPRGLLLPEAVATYPAISPEQVRVTTTPAVIGTMVGTINAESYAPNATNDSVAALESYAVKLAADAGANELVIHGVFRDPSDSTLHLFAKAVHV